MDLSPTKLQQYRSRIILAMLGLLIAIFYLACSWPRYRRDMESVHWPTTQGVITESQLKPGYVRILGTPTIAGHYADVRYRYTVGATVFLGDRISFDPSLRSEESARKEFDRYPVGKILSAYYDPAKPAVAVLVPGLQKEQRHALFLGLGLMAAFILVFCFLTYVVCRLNRELKKPACSNRKTTRRFSFRRAEAIRLSFENGSNQNGA